MLFTLPEYDNAARKATFAAVNALAQAQNELLAEIESEAVSELHNSRLTTESGEAVRSTPVQIRGSFEMSISAICAGDLGEVLRAMDEVATQQVRDLLGGMFECLRVVTTATGNTVDAAGRPLTHELVFELLEKIDIAFDDDGQANLTLVAGPDVARKIAALPEMTPEQQRRYDEILARKREEFLAGRRERRLRPPQRGS